MKILVCGSRTFHEPRLIREFLSQQPGLIRLVIHGGARGADIQAGLIAKELGIEQIAFPADWSKYGKRAGFKRNIEMLDAGKPDLVAAFFDGTRTTGTMHTINEARKRNIPVKEFGLKVEAQ